MLWVLVGYEFIGHYSLLVISKLPLTASPGHGGRRSAACSGISRHFFCPIFPKLMDFGHPVTVRLRFQK
jgi:hypothetical protein